MADETELEGRVAALATEVAALRAQFDEARGGIDQTLRGQGRCRACGGRSVLHATEVLYSDGMGGNRLAVSPLQGEFEVYICARCGLVEWYVKRPDWLEPDGEKVRVRVEQGGPPYR